MFLHPTLPHPQEVNKAQAATRARLDTEYRRLVDNLVEAQQLRGGEEWLSNPTLPEDVVQESMPGGPAVLRCWLVLGSACIVKRLEKCLEKTCYLSSSVSFWLTSSRYVTAGPGSILSSFQTLAVSAAECYPAGNIRRAEHFISFLRRFVAYLGERMNAPAVVSEGPAAFLAGVQQAVAVDAKTLR